MILEKFPQAEASVIASSPAVKHQPLLHLAVERLGTSKPNGFGTAREALDKLLAAGAKLTER